MLKHWGLVVVLLYAVLTIALSGPVVFVAFVGEVDLDDAFGTYLAWPFWAWLAVMLLCQAALLLVPVRMASRRPITRLALFWPLFASGFLVGCLALGATLSITEVFALSDPPDWVGWASLGIGGTLWVGWTLVFYRFAQGRYAPAIVSRQCSYLLKGSILELLVAVPTHIVARHRDYCCAGFLTFVGLVAGIAVMLYSFGPGVFFLYLERWRRLHPVKESS